MERKEYLIACPICRKIETSSAAIGKWTTKKYYVENSKYDCDESKVYNKVIHLSCGAEFIRDPESVVDISIKDFMIVLKDNKIISKGNKVKNITEEEIYEKLRKDLF